MLALCKGLRNGMQMSVAHHARSNPQRFAQHGQQPDVLEVTQ